jgi:hypothetical protein
MNLQMSVVAIIAQWGRCSTFLEPIFALLCLYFDDTFASYLLSCHFFSTSSSLCLGPGIFGFLFLLSHVDAFVAKNLLSFNFFEKSHDVCIPKMIIR